MSNDTTEILSHARERAEARLDAALGAIRKATLAIAREHNIPEGVLGHDQVDLLGRILHSPGLSRDLRREACQLMAKQELEALHERPAAARRAAPVDPPPSLSGGQPVIPMSKALLDLDGVNAATVKALNQANLQVVGDVVNVPDEHLAKLTSLAPQAIAKLRTAIAKAAAVEGAK